MGDDGVDYSIDLIHYRERKKVSDTLILLVFSWISFYWLISLKRNLWQNAQNHKITTININVAIVDLTRSINSIRAGDFTSVSSIELNNVNPFIKAHAERKNKTTLITKIKIFWIFICICFLFCTYVHIYYI